MISTQGCSYHLHNPTRYPPHPTHLIAYPELMLHYKFFLSQYTRNPTMLLFMSFFSHIMAPITEKSQILPKSLLSHHIYPINM